MKKGNIIFGALCLILSGIFIGIAARFPRAAAYGTGVPGPAVWPVCIALVVAVCGLIVIVKALRSRRGAAQSQPVTSNTEAVLEETLGAVNDNQKKLQLWTSANQRVYLCILVLAAYVFLLDKIGFIIMTTAMLCVFIQWFYKKKFYITLPIALAITLLVYFVFRNFLNVPIDFGMFPIL